MASKAECDRYAMELSRRFDELIKWAIVHWPNEQCVLQPSDFSAARRELSHILGPMLGDGDGSLEARLDKPRAPYRHLKPMPWP